MKEPNEIDLLFQNGLNDLAFTPDPYVKENIDHAITSKKKRRRFLFILFPVLLGLMGFAAIGLFYQNPKENEHENKLHTQNEIRRRSVAADLYEDSSDDLTWNDSHSQKKIESKSRFARNNSQTTNSSTIAKSASHQKIKSLITWGGRPVPVDKKINPETGFELNTPETDIENTLVNPIDSIQVNRRRL